MGAQQSAASTFFPPIRASAGTGSAAPGPPNRGGAAGRRIVGQAAAARGAQRRNIAQLNPRQPVNASAYDPEGAADGPAVVFSRNPLCDAVALCEMEAVDLLLRDARIDVNAPNEEGETALHIATRRGHINLIELLLHAGARVNSSDRLGFTPLHHAVHTDLAAARTLLDTHFPPVNGVPMSAIHVACSNEHLLRLLLRHGGDPTAAALDGSTCLHMALRLRRIPECVLLMTSSSQLLARTLNNESALHALASLQVVNLLDAGIKSLFFTVRRPKADISEDASRRHQIILPGSRRNLATVARRLRRGAATAQKDSTRIPMMLSRPVDTLDRLCVKTESQAWQAAHLLYPHWLPAAPRDVSDACAPSTTSPTQVGLLFAVPVAQRTRLPLRVLVQSDRFRHQGLLPANALADGSTGAVAPTDIPIQCCTRARIADDERLYISDVARYSRVRMGRVLAVLVAGKMQDAAAARAAKPSSGAMPEAGEESSESSQQLEYGTGNDVEGASGSGSNATKRKAVAATAALARSSVLTMDLFLDFLDALDAKGNVEQPDELADGTAARPRSTVGGVGLRSEDDSDSNSDSPETVPTNEEVASVLPTSVAPRAKSPLRGQPSSASPLLRSAAAQHVSLQDKMNLLRGLPQGARYDVRAGESASLSSSTALATSPSRPDALVHGAKFNGLIGIDSALPNLANPLDLVITDGEHAGKTVLAMVNDAENPVVNAVNEKRCILMLLSVRAQLLLEDSFGILMCR